MDITPLPTKSNVLSRLISEKLPITSVVDVGVRECTGELINSFGDLTHYLFEPVSLFFDTIEKNYSNIKHELFPIALSDSDSEFYLMLKALNKDGVVTHSQIMSEPVEPDGREIIECKKVDVRRFDNLPLSRLIEANFLLKIDVDGKDLHVAMGFGSKLSLASAIIIECTFRTALERLSYMQNSGFQLFDIVDLVYYGPGIYQFDMVFVRTNLLTSNLRPAIQNFDPKLWCPI